MSKDQEKKAQSIEKPADENLLDLFKLLDQIDRKNKKNRYKANNKSNA